MTPRADARWFVSPEAFVRTYDAPSHADPWELVEEYRAVVAYTSRYPDHGSTEIAEHLDIPRSRLRKWIRDDQPSRPDCVRGLHVAEGRRWIGIEPDSRIFRGMNVLVATIFSGGTISDRDYVPSFRVTGGHDIARVLQALQWVGTEFRIKRVSPPGHASEIWPTDAASILGRVLVVLGGPKGRKRDADLSLPPYLALVENEHRRAFARTYLYNRGIRDISATDATFREERDAAYVAELTEFFSDLAGEQVHFDGEEIIVPHAAARALDVA